MLKTPLVSGFFFFHFMKAIRVAAAHIERILMLKRRGHLVQQSGDSGSSWGMSADKKHDWLKSINECSWDCGSWYGVALCLPCSSRCVLFVFQAAE